MKTRWFVAAALSAVAVAAACSKSSTGPSDPYAGTWQITWAGVPATQSLSPSPWNITVAKSGTSYTATYPNLTWSYTSPAVSPIDTYSDAAASSSFGIMAGTFQLHAQDPSAPACELSLVGTFSGSTASGSVNAAGTMCVPGSWTFSATRQ